MSNNINALLAIAVDMRAAGHSWAAIAKKLHRQTRTCMNWPTRYKAKWDPMYVALQKARYEQISNECGSRFLGMVRSDDPKIQAKAHELWMKYAAKCYGTNGTMVMHESTDSTPSRNQQLHDEMVKDMELARRRIDARRSLKGLPPTTDEDFLREWESELDAVDRAAVGDNRSWTRESSGAEPVKDLNSHESSYGGMGPTILGLLLLAAFVLGDRRELRTFSESTRPETRPALLYCEDGDVRPDAYHRNVSVIPTAAPEGRPMVARGEALRTPGIGSGLRVDLSPGGATESVAPPGLNGDCNAGHPGVALRSTPGYHRSPLRGCTNAAPTIHLPPRAFERTIDSRDSFLAIPSEDSPVAFRCPYCQFRIATKTPPKPGKYTPSCPKCKAKIALTVPADPSAEWTTAKIPGEKPDADPGSWTRESSEAGPSPPLNSHESSYESGGTPASETIGGLTPSIVGASTEATGDFGQRPPATDDRTVAQAPDVDRTGAFAGAARTKVGSDDTVAPTGSPSAKKQKRKSPGTEVDIPNTLGGYEVMKELGRGGMGSVFLARQVSLDRPVALKVMNSKWSNDPIFLARFTREAFAAAQLVHHNVVQIYDIGEEQGINFFSMEFVEGKSLGDILKKDGKLDVPAAVGYTLQAARGLKFAHDRGMVHRDVKPDNLMLNVHGIVKVADLGLVKTPTMTPEDDLIPHGALTDPGSVKSMTGLKSLRSDITLAHTAMGSPAYMSPEQCKDAANVDPRADIYSLGCSLYALLTGRPPFQGGSVFDVMAKHSTEPPAPIRELPNEVNAFVLKSLAKRPEDRQQSMEEFITGLERLLPNKAAVGPSEEHLKALEESVRKFQSASMANARRPLILAFLLGSLIAAVVGLYFSALAAGAVLALVVETLIAYFIVDGIFGKTYVFRKVREYAFGARIGDWAIGVVGVIALLVVLWLVGLLWVWLGTAVVAIAIAFVFHFIVDRQISTQRQSALNECEHMLKRLRLAGMDEESLRLFVAKNAGQGWEEFHEAMFGFESKLAARPAVEAQAGGKLPRFAAWREPVIARLDRALQARREAKSRLVLEKLETKKLEAEGVDRREARAQAEAAAEQMVEQAAEIRVAKDKTVNIRSMIARAEKPAKRRPKPAGYQLRKATDAILGWKVRFVVAAALIAVGAFWVRHQIDPARIQQSVSNVADADTSESTQAAAKQAAGSLSGLLVRGNPLDFPVVGQFVDSLNPLVAGLIILMSTFNRRAQGIWIQLVGAAVALFGHRLGVIPEIGPVQPHQLTMIVGLGLAIVGVVVSRK
jgi:serine/threonine protein kinase